MASSDTPAPVPHQNDRPQVSRRASKGAGSPKQPRNASTAPGGGRQSTTPSVAAVLASAVLLMVVALLLGRPWLAGIAPVKKQQHPGLICGPNETSNYHQLVQKLDSAAMLHNVELGTFSGVRGLKAARHIPRGSPVLAVPFAHTLSIATSSARDAAAKATRKWAKVEDGDIQLDTLALLYEVYVKGPATEWAAYLCTIPPWFDLPLQYNDSWSLHVVAALPDMQRLLDKRKAQVAQYEAMTRKAIAAMPGGAARLKQDKGLRDFSYLFKWAYMATKTRTVTLDLDQPLGQVRLPSHFKWLTEMGVLVPVLDLANHAGGDAATAMFSVDMRSSSLTQGATPVLSLVAARDIEPGEQITFSYLPDDDEAPYCNQRWLLEYGFIIQDGKPQRDCYIFNASLTDLAAVLGEQQAVLPAALQSRAKTAKEWSKVLKELERDQGLPAAATIEFVRGGPGVSDASQQLVSWVHEALGGRGGEADTLKVACLLLKAHASKLTNRMEISRRVGMAVHQTPELTYRQTALMELLLGAARAVADELQTLGC